MNKILNRPIMALLLCGLLLSGCQAATPKPVAPTATPTLVAPTATVRPEQTPTVLPTALNEEHIRITKYHQNYTAFRIEIQGGATIITDPYMMEVKTQADIVTESHQHMDHTDVRYILPPYKLLTKPGVFDLAGIKITAVDGMHNKLVSGYELPVQNVIYVFDLGGIRLAQFGSQGQVPTAEMFAQIGKVDVLIIQVFRELNHKLNMPEAKSIVEQLSPRIIIPAHGDQGVNEEFATLIGADFQPEPSGILDLSRSDLDQLKTPVLVVLDN